MKQLSDIQLDTMSDVADQADTLILLIEVLEDVNGKADEETIMGLLSALNGIGGRLLELMDTASYVLNKA